MHLSHIVPRFPPGLCGLYDYASLLAQALQERHNVRNRLFRFSGDSSGLTDKSIEIPLPHGNLPPNPPWEKAMIPSVLTDPGSVVILHYSGYGYSPKGAPFWLPRFLQSLKRSPSPPVIVTMFHEVFAPFSRSPVIFYRSLTHRFVARKICQASDRVRTNRTVSAKWLQDRQLAPHPVAALPVFSNLGELSEPQLRGNTPQSLLLFQPPPFSESGSRYWNAWQQITEQWPNIQTIVGGRCTKLPETKNLRNLGVLNRAAAHSLFSSVDLALFDYFDGYLAKSGIFAALAAHSIPILLASPNQSSPDGLLDGTHYLSSTHFDRLKQPRLLHDLASSGFNWYSNHSVVRTADDYLRHLVQTGWNLQYVSISR